MSPIEIRNEKAAGKVIKDLARRNIEAWYCPTATEAVNKLLELIPAGSSITWGGSMSIRDIGIPAALENADMYEIFDRDKAPDRAAATEIYLRAFGGAGNRGTANAFTPAGVIVEIGGTSARSTAAPINTARFDIKTPCKIDGVCHNCLSEDCICNYIHYLRHSPKGKHKVIIVGESLGY